ncbi:prepilin-type N-terminal cleavage/methylation domain-containing protein [bacterium]|nr:prepilin-type N-terminal cleavage/methylation domain-containing protein [bacterium]
MMMEKTRAFAHNQAISEKVPSRARFVHPRRGFTLLELLAVMVILSMITVSLFTIFSQGSETWRRSGARTEAYLKARQILEMMSREIKGAVLITTARGPDAEPDGPSDPPKRADFRGLDADGLQEWRNNEQEFSDQIYFVTPVANSGRQELCMIGYWVKDVEEDTTSPLGGSGVPGNSRDDVFWRTYLTDGNSAPPPDEWLTFDFTSLALNSWSSQIGEVALSVRQLDIKYYDYEDVGGLEEYDEWDSRPTTISGPSKYKGTTLTKDDDNKLPVAVKITITVGDKDNFIKPIRLSTIVYLENAVRRLF